MTVELVAPDVRYHRSFVESLDEWGADHQDGAGLWTDRPSDDLRDEAVFADWVDYLLASERGERLPEGFVPCTFRWMVDGSSYVGSIALRHHLNPWLEQFGGHIGYGVRPSERGRGLAAWALHRTLATALDLGLDRVLLTANDANPASWRTIERCGGVMQDVIRDGKGYLRRYRITL